MDGAVVVGDTVVKYSVDDGIVVDIVGVGGACWC